MTSKMDSKTVPAPYQNDPRVERDPNGNWHVRGYTEARDLLKADLIQDGFAAESVRQTGFNGVLYMHGEPHRQMRAGIAKYFSPTTVQNTHMAIIEKTAGELMERIKKEKRVNLRHLTRDMAAIIVTAIVGLNPSRGLIHRLDAMLHAKALPENSFRALLQNYYNQYHRLAFLFADVMPAIRRRRKAPQNDVISYMLSKEKRPMDIFVECVVYGAAGVATTQEFICVVLLHCMEDPKFCEIMLSDDASARYEALNEILRLEPVIGKLYRRAAEPVTVRTGDQDVTIPPGERIAFHVYDVNVDPQAVLECPHQRQAHRELEKGVYRSLIGFGSGPHRCAGEHLALAETDVFIQKLLRLPGLRIEKAPDILRNEAVEGYEIHDLILTVD